MFFRFKEYTTKTGDIVYHIYQCERYRGEDHKVKSRDKYIGSVKQSASADCLYDDIFNMLDDIPPKERHKLIEKLDGIK